MPASAPRSAALAAAVQAVTGQTVEVGFVDQGYTGDDRPSRRRRARHPLEVVKLPEAKRGFVLLAPALGRGALLRLGGALPPPGQGLRTLARNGGGLAFCGLCLPDASSITHRRRPKSITRSRRRGGENARGQAAESAIGKTVG